MTKRNPLFRFQLSYFLFALAIFVIEVLIALYMHDAIIRPYVGDVLVVILLYCLVKSFIDTPVFATAIGVLLFSYLIEALQYFHYVEWFGLQDSALASTIMGTYFAWTDLFAYTIGIAIVLMVEKKPF